MNARNKLNVAYLNGSIAVAALVAALVGFWPIFFLVLIVGLLANLYAGDIRPFGKKRRS